MWCDLCGRELESASEQRLAQVILIVAKYQVHVTHTLTKLVDRLAPVKALRRAEHQRISEPASRFRRTLRIGFSQDLTH